MTKTNESNLVTIEHNDPIRFYDKAHAYLNTILNSADMGSLMRMAIILKTSKNMIYNGDVPHTNETLQQYLKKSSKSGFLAFMKRLKEAGVVYKATLTVQGKVRVTYMMNPYFANRYQELDKILFTIFEDFPTVNK